MISYHASGRPFTPAIAKWYADYCHRVLTSCGPLLKKGEGLAYQSPSILERSLRPNIEIFLERADDNVITPLRLPSLTLLSTPFFKSATSLGMYARPKNTSTTRHKPPICTDPFETIGFVSLMNPMLRCSGALFGSVVSSRLRLYRIIGFKSSNGLWEWSSRFTASISTTEICLRITCELSLRFLSL